MPRGSQADRGAVSRPHAGTDPVRSRPPGLRPPPPRRPRALADPGRRPGPGDDRTHDLRSDLPGRDPASREESATLEGARPRAAAGCAGSACRRKPASGSRARTPGFLGSATARGPGTAGTARAGPRPWTPSASSRAPPACGSMPAGGPAAPVPGAALRPAAPACRGNGRSSRSRAPSAGHGG